MSLNVAALEDMGAILSDDIGVSAPAGMRSFSDEAEEATEEDGEGESL